MMNEIVELLIVEDSVTQAMSLKHILEKQRYCVFVSQNGEEALDFISKRKPTLVISDIVMPTMDGYTFCEKVKSDPNLKDIPVILLTSLSEPTEIIRGLKCGANNFITKPFEEEYLLSRIHHILINQELRKNHGTDIGIEIFFAGQKHNLNSERMQILDLLLASYETTIQKNQELKETNLKLLQTQALLKKQEEILRSMSVVDELTGLYNRRGFMELARQQLLYSQRTKKEISLVFFDLDSMKSINDTYGHTQGDRALVDTARLIEKTFRKSDIKVRIGGDEFIVLAVNASKDGIENLVHRMQENIKTYNAEKKSPFNLSISYGIAQCDPERPCSLEDLLHRADSIMYEQKQKKM